MTTEKLNDKVTLFISVAIILVFTINHSGQYAIAQSSNVSSGNSTDTHQDSWQSQDPSSPTSNASNETSNTGYSNSTETNANSTSTPSEETNVVKNSTLQTNNITSTNNTASIQIQNSISTDNTQTPVNDTASIEDSILASLNISNLPLPDFIISIDSNSTNIKLGETRTYIVTVSSLNGFNSSVILNIPQSIPRVITAFSTSPTVVPANGSATSTLVIVADKYAPTGIYDLTINGTMTRLNGTIVSHSVTMKLELWQEPIMPTPQPTITANSTIQSEKTGVNSTSLRYLDVKDLNETIYGNVTKQSMVMISTVVSNNNNNKTQPFVVVIEVMDNQQVTDYIQLQKGTLPPAGEAEIGISWVPDHLGTYQVRSFVLDGIIQPEPLSSPVEKTIEVK